MKTATAMIENCHTPVNSLAGRGFGNDTRLWTLSECPTLYPIPFKELARRLPGKRRMDITGMRCGSMVIIGLIEMEGGVNSSQWAARCDCGRYETRRYRNFLTGAIKGFDACCQVCADKDPSRFKRDRK